MKSSSNRLYNHFSLIQLSIEQANSVHKIFNRNMNFLSDYFHESLSYTTTLENTQDYLKECSAESNNEFERLYGLKFRNDLIGILMVKNINSHVRNCELAYFIDNSLKGRGFGTKMVLYGLDLCFVELNMRKVILKIDPKNISSLRVAQKCGFTLEGTLKKEFIMQDKSIIDVHYYGLLVENYNRRAQMA